MEWKILFLTLLSVVPSLWAYPGGAPSSACANVMPQHGVESRTDGNNGFILMSRVIDSGSYVPEEVYEVRLESLISNFRGFFIQARTEDNTIVGTWTPMNDAEAQTIMCNGADSAVTHRSRDEKDGQIFMWTAPSSDVGRVHFIYSIVIAYTNIIVGLNATVDRVPTTVPPPPPPPPNAEFLNSYGQPEGCQQDDCDFFVEWRSNGNLFADFRLRGGANGWITMGIATDTLSLSNTRRNFSDILLCQAENVGNTVNVKDLYLEGGSLIPMRDSSENGTEHTSGEIDGSGTISCNFSHVVFPLGGQEGEDASFSAENYLFFLSGNDRGGVSELPPDFNTSVLSGANFSTTTININQGFVLFTGTFNDLPGRGSYPTAGCSREDCDFYFRWGRNPNNPNYLTFFISADLLRGWAAIGTSTDRRMGGDEIDDVFGCITNSNGGELTVADTYNIAGGERSNVGDSSGLAGIVMHSSGVVDGRIECTFSRIIAVLPREETSDFNLDNSYYIIIGTGEQQGAPFPRHERNPEWSTSKVNLVRETSVDFDYSRVPLIKTHGIFMILAWPVLAYLGIAMARHMKPALPNGGWFQVHRVLVLTSLFFTCLAFLLIFVAFRNNETRGLITLGDMNELGTAHFVIGIIVVALQFTNPIIALFRCKPNAENRWIFNIFHKYIIGLTVQLAGVANVMIGLYLFGDKIANPQDLSAYYVMVALVSATGFVDGMMHLYFGLSTYYCAEKTKPTGKQSEIKMTQIGSSDSKSQVPPSKEEGAPPSKKTPSPDHWFRWAGWIALASIAGVLGITAIGIVGSG